VPINRLLRAICTLVAVVKFSARLATSGSSLACFTRTVSRSANLDTIIGAHEPSS
jgi:hypothetical protein